VKYTCYYLCYCYNLYYCCYAKTSSSAVQKRQSKVYGNPIAPSFYSISPCFKRWFSILQAVVFHTSSIGFPFFKQWFSILQTMVFHSSNNGFPYFKQWFSILQTMVSILQTMVFHTSNSGFPYFKQWKQWFSEKRGTIYLRIYHIGFVSQIFFCILPAFLSLMINAKFSFF